MKTIKPTNLANCCTLAIVLGLLNNSVFAHGDEASEIATPAAAYNAASSGTENLTLGPVTIKMLLDQSNLGRRDIEVGELNLPVSYGEGGAHPHGSLEIFYIVEGIMGHEVNGKAYTLNPGDVGFVNPGDKVKHSVLSDVPVKAVVIWLPGGEADNLVKHAGFKRETIE